MGILFLGSVLLSAVAVVLLWQKNQALSLRLKTVTEDLSRTSKILIEKNLELVDQNIEQQKLLESKDDFINIVSHQLRTPITEVKWSIDSILKDPLWKLKPTQRASLEALYSSVEHSIRLINDIVHLVSVEQGAAHLAVVPYNPEEVVQAATHKIIQNFADKKITLVIDTTCDGCVINSIDPDSLTMIVSNLIDNAYYYTHDSGKVEVHTSTVNEKYVVVVSDTGIGMSEEQQKAIFTKFRRSNEAIQANARGSGLGLYIVKKIIEYHKGTVSFSSVEGAGTTFTLTLPRVSAEV